jgi:hypothetical protein
MTVEEQRIECGAHQMIQELTALSELQGRGYAIDLPRLYRMARWLVGRSMAGNFTNLVQAWEATRNDV